MSDDGDDSRFLQWVDQLRRGCITDFLRHDGFPAWIELVSAPMLQQELRGISNADEAALCGQFREEQVRTLARRLILSRNRGLFDSLQPLWCAFGSNSTHHGAVLNALESVQNEWPTEVCRVGDDHAVAPDFTSAYADFVEALRCVGTNDTAGVLGAAIRTSRIVDERLHVGFPLVISGSDRQNLRDGLWVTPTTSLPQERCESLHNSWESLWQSVVQLTRAGQSTAETLPGLPAWLHRLVETAGWNVETMESAGLGLAMQLLARRTDRSLPFGIGFTGRWEAEQLRGVHDLAAKARAAREAGVFLLFACADPDEPAPEGVEGVRLVLLPEGLCLNDVVRKVNRFCADSGLTEYRWRDSQRRFRAVGATSTAHTPDLPEALDHALCPVGFVGREQALDSLQREISQQHTTRRLIAITAPARSGKTTLLSRFASQQTPYPIWFSFRRGQASRRTLAQLQDAVCDQMAARYNAVPMPSQSSTGNVPTEERLRSLMDAICGPVPLLVDGIDEAQSPQDVIDWLQTVPGTGLSLIGSQPIAALNQINGTQIRLQNETESGQEDARSLIACFATRFAETDHLRPIADQLQQNQWINGLCETSGNNLWVLTEFLSAIERDQAGWPASPSELPLSPNVREYCHTLMEAALADYQRDHRSHVERFLAFRSYLDNRPWRVHDVLRLAGNSLSGAPFGAWGGTGLLASSVRRLLEFDGTHCRFWNALTREAVHNSYRSYASEVSRQFIELLQNDASQSDLLDHVTESVPSLLVEVADAGLTRTLLFESPWIHRRARLLTRQRQSVTTLRAELVSLIPSLPSDRAGDVRRLVDWLVGWGWAVDDSPNLIDQWWDAAGEVIQPFPRVDAPFPETTGDRRLLAPIVGPGVTDARYDIPWPASPQFHGAACEILEGSTSRLVFVASRHGSSCDLLVYRGQGNAYVRERFIRLPEGEGAFALASMPYPEVATLVRLPNEGCELRVFDVRSGQSRTLLTDSRVVKLEVLSADPQRLLVVRCESHRDAPSPCRLFVIDLNGQQVADVWLPFVQSESHDIEVVPFGSDRFCVLGHQAPGEPREIRLYHLEPTSERWEISELSRLPISSVNGACALPDNRLAVTHRGRETGESWLSILRADGTLELQILLYRKSRQPGDGARGRRREYTFHDATVGCFLLNCKPVGRHPDYGVLLATENENSIYSVRVEHEAIPRTLPDELLRELDTGDSTTDRQCILSISSHRTLFVFSSGATILGPGLTDILPIEGGPSTETTTEIVGVRADGAIVVCDGYVNPDNLWSRDNYRTSQPPFVVESNAEIGRRGEEVRVTPDGWEVRWYRQRAILIARRADGGAVFRWDAAQFFGGVDLNSHNERVVASFLEVDDEEWSSAAVEAEDEPDESPQVCIVDAIGNGRGEVIVATQVGENVSFVRMNLSSSSGGPQCEVVAQDRHNVRLEVAWRDLLVYHVLDQEDQTVAIRLMEWTPEAPRDCNCPRSARSIRILPLADTEALLIEQRHWHRFVPGQSWFWRNGSDDLVPVDDLAVPFPCFVVDAIIDGLERCFRVISVVNRHWQWNLETATVRVLHMDPFVRVQSTNTTSLRGEVTCWTRFENYIVIGYATGRIEVRSRGQPNETHMVAFATDRPEDVVIVRRPEGRFLVVSVGRRLEWFPCS